MEQALTALYGEDQVLAAVITLKVDTKEGGPHRDKKSQSSR